MLVDGECPNLGDPKLHEPGLRPEVVVEEEPAADEQPVVVGPPTGTIVVFPWPSSGESVLGMITDQPDADGLIGVMVLNPHVRVAHEDMKEP